MKKEVKILRGKAIASLVLSIASEHSHRPEKENERGCIDE